MSAATWQSRAVRRDLGDPIRLLDELGAEIRTASRLALAWFRRPLDVESKTTDGFDPVTAADRAVEDAIRTVLVERYPDHRIVGEERGTTGDGDLTWIIDPIDGTRAFVSGNPLFGTLVGVRDDDRVLAGWMHLPVLDETYAGTGSMARLDGPGGRTELRTRSAVAVGAAIVCCTHPDMFSDPDEAAAFDRVWRACRMTRFGGDCANFGLLALGHVDAVIETDLAPYDIAPLVPIVEGAGGIVTGRSGGDPTQGGFVVASSSRELHDELLAMLA